MPDPLSSDVVATLKADACAALAAIVIISNAHSGLLAWAQRAIAGNPPPTPETANESSGAEDAGGGNPARLAANSKDGANVGEPKTNGAGRSNGIAPSDRAKKGARAKGPHNPRETAAKHDEALLALMRANSEATVTELIHLSGRPRNSATLSLERLEKAGLVEHAGRGKWIAVDPDLLDVPTPRPAGWIEPLSGAHVAKHPAAMRVRDEATMAASPH